MSRGKSDNLLGLAALGGAGLLLYMWYTNNTTTEGYGGGWDIFGGGDSGTGTGSPESKKAETIRATTPTYTPTPITPTMTMPDIITAAVNNFANSPGVAAVVQETRPQQVAVVSDIVATSKKQAAGNPITYMAVLPFNIVNSVATAANSLQFASIVQETRPQQVEMTKSIVDAGKQQLNLILGTPATKEETVTVTPDPRVEENRNNPSAWSATPTKKETTTTNYNTVAYQTLFNKKLERGM